MQRLNDPGVRNSGEFADVIKDCTEEIHTLLGGILEARPAQLEGHYDARDCRQAQYCCAACGVRTVTQASAPYTRFSLEQLRPVFSYATATNVAFTEKQLVRIESGRRHVDWVSGLTACNMLDYYEHST